MTSIGSERDGLIWSDLNESLDSVNQFDTENIRNLARYLNRKYVVKRSHFGEDTLIVCQQPSSIPQNDRLRLANH